MVFLGNKFQYFKIIHFQKNTSFEKNYEKKCQENYFYVRISNILHTTDKQL